MSELPLLKTSGALGHKSSYEPTNQDLLQNAYEQNKAINVLTTNMADIKTTVANHVTVITELKSIKEVVLKFWWAALWILMFLGLSGLVAIGKWLISLIHF